MNQLSRQAVGFFDSPRLDRSDHPILSDRLAPTAGMNAIPAAEF
jgi:hypothetical protein